MRKRVSRRHEAHVRVQAVCAEHRTLFDATPGGQKARAILGTGVTEVDRLLAVQEQTIVDRRGATTRCLQARSTLRNAAKAGVAVGKAVNVDNAVKGTLRLPTRANDDELLAYSRALLDHLSAHADAFVAEGLPPDIVKHLEEGIAAFAAAREAQAVSRQRFTAAFEAIRETLDETDTAVGILEAIALNTPEALPEVLTKLRMARRVGPRVTEPAPKPAPPVVPSSTPTDKAA
jgi:hypothetical protein